MTSTLAKIQSLINSVSTGPTLYPARVTNDRFLVWWMAVLILARLWLVESQFDVLATYTPADDYLFIRLAKNILSGAWLGPYDHYTLVKGPVYPLFIAFSHLTGIPLLLAQQLLFSIFCILVVVIFRPLFKSQWPLVIIFSFLLFMPFMNIYPTNSRVLRLALSMPLVLCVFGLFGSLLIRSRGSILKLFLWSTLLGVSFSLLWFTREEGIWLLPSLILFMLYFLVINSGLKWKEFFKRMGCLLWIGVIFIGFKLTFSALNQHYYGAPVIIELKAQEFQAALGGLMNIDGLGSKRYVPVSLKSQRAALEASPTFSQLTEYFEEEAKKKRQLLPSLYIWKLRDVVAKSGNANSLPEALSFYAAMGRELQQACDRGELTCLDRKPSIRPVWHGQYFSLVPETFWKIFKYAVTFSFYDDEKDDYQKWRSDAKPEWFGDYEYVTGAQLVPSTIREIQQLPPKYLHMIEEKFRVLIDIGSVYKVFVPWMFILALIIHVIGVGKSVVARSIYFEIIYGLIILGGIISMISILTYVRITLWPIKRPLFSVYPLVLLYISVMIPFLWNNLLRRNPPGTDPYSIT